MHIDKIAAIDVHVHLEHEGEATASELAAQKYFGKGQGPAGGQALAEYYRSRNFACVVFTVDERLTGRPHKTNDQILEFAAQNADIVLPFISIDPTRGKLAIDEARRLLAT